jgi:hypothetical protein
MRTSCSSCVHHVSDVEVLRLAVGTDIFTFHACWMEGCAHGSGRDKAVLITLLPPCCRTRLECRRTRRMALSGQALVTLAAVALVGVLFAKDLGVSSGSSVRSCSSRPRAQIARSRPEPGPSAFQLASQRAVHVHSVHGLHSSRTAISMGCMSSAKQGPCRQPARSSLPPKPAALLQRSFTKADCCLLCTRCILQVQQSDVDGGRSAGGKMHISFCQS